MAPCCARSAGMEGDENGNCGDCRTLEEELYWNRFQSFYFFQILSSIPEFHNQLAIPKKFANNARALLPTIVTLRGPSRASWSAVMIKTGEDTFLTDGWEEFVKAYSLQASDILIFKFDGVSAFDIQIFDGQNRCEKESAYFVKKWGHENYAENPRKRASTVDDIEEYSDGLTHRATKKAREEAVNETRNRPSYSHFFSRSRTKKYVRKSRKWNKIMFDFSENTSIPSGERGQSNVQTEPSNNEPRNSKMLAPPSNRSFSTENPPQDSPHINGSNLTEASPQRRHETYGRCSNEATPRVDSSRGRGRTINTISLASSRKIQTKVSSSKAVYSVGRPRKQLGAIKAGVDIALGSPNFSRTYVFEEGRLAFEMARKQMTGNSCISVMRPTSVCGRYMWTFPSAWCRKHLSPVSQDMFVQFGDKIFLTWLTYSPSTNMGRITGGWKQVVEANQLKLHDVCLFNIAGRKDDALMLDVNVFRAGLQQTPVEPANGELSPITEFDGINSSRQPLMRPTTVYSGGSPRKQLGANKAGDDIALGKPDFTRTYVVSELQTQHDGRLALEMASKHMTENSFIAVMRPTSVCGRYMLTFPIAWCKKHLSNVSQDLFIRFGDKTFLTRLNYSPRKLQG